MGMAASQGRLLALTSRKNDIGYELTRLSNQKVLLSRDMQKVTKDYQAALNAKQLKWSNNAGITYTDISYNNLMRPSEMNQMKPYMLTDLNGRIVVDSKYLDYAKMISPDGRAGGDWSGDTRLQILSELTGLSKNDIGNVESLGDAIYENDYKVQNLANDKRNDTSSIQGKNNFNSFRNLVFSSSTTKINASNFDSVMAQFKSYAKYLDAGIGEDANAKAWNAACENILTISHKKQMENKEEIDSPILNGKNGSYTLDVDEALSTIISIYANTGMVTQDNSLAYGSKGYQTPIWFDKYDSNGNYTEKYKTWNQNYTAWRNEYSAAVNNYNTSLSNYNMTFSAEQEKLIAFYDSIFSSIAENGWSYNADIDNPEYLNQMLQNNMLTITEVDRSIEYNQGSNGVVTHSYTNKYDTDIASNFNKIVTVNDSDKREDALVDYEYKKSLINAKESRIDTRMKNLETEQSAIVQMIQGIEQVKDNNIERTFSIFS